MLAQMAPVDREAACLLMHILLTNAPDAAALTWHLRGCWEQPPARAGPQALGQAGSVHAHSEPSQGRLQHWQQQGGTQSPSMQGRAGGGAFT